MGRNRWHRAPGTTPGTRVQGQSQGTPRGRISLAVSLVIAVVLALPAVLLPAGYAAAAPHAVAGAATPAVTVASGFQQTVVFSGLTSPTSIRFAADGRVYVAEKSGIIKVFSSLEATTPTVFADLRTEVDDYWDRGLLGIELDPNFPARPYVYATYTYDAPIGGTAPTWNDTCPTPPGPTTDGCVVSGRVVRLTADASGNTMIPGSEKVLVSGWCMQFPSHTIDDIRFGPDGALYVSGGDGASFNGVDYGQYGNRYAGDKANPCGDPPAGVGGTQTPPSAEGGALRAQSLQRAAGEPAVLNGTLIRIDPATGDALPTNPLYNKSDANARRIVASGLRNPYRFIFRPGTNEVWIGDVGWNTVEEVDRLLAPTATPVNNYGWPCYEGNTPEGGYQSAGLSICAKLYNTTGAVTKPYYSYLHSARVVSGESCPTGNSSITGVAFYTGDSYPAAYRNALFFADYSRNCIWAMKAGSNGLPDPNAITPIISGGGYPVDLEAGPDGDIFYVDFTDGQVGRIQAIPPHAVAVATSPATGPAPLAVRFDGSQSTDSDPNATLSYAWDLNGDGAFDDSTALTPSYTYLANGQYQVRLKVTDSRGLISVSSPLTVIVGDPPLPAITTPAASLTWRVGDVIPFSGSANDSGGNALPASALTWTILLQHCSGSTQNCHSHLVQTIAGVASGSFTAPDHEYPSYLELRLTATSTNGVQGTTSVSLYPKTVNVTFQTAPAGLQLAAGGEPAPAPFTKTFILGSSTTISAPSPQTRNATTYSFTSWSDGGTASHTIFAGETFAGETPTTYTATFTPGGPLTEAGKLTLKDTSTDAPALWTAGTTPPAGAPVAVLGWVGTDQSHHLNIMRSYDGTTFKDKITLPDTSDVRPAVLVVNNTVVVIAWRGTDRARRLNVLYDVFGQRTKMTFSDSASSPPSLDLFNGQIWIAWTGTDSARTLNVMPLGARGLAAGAKTTLRGNTSPYAPQLITDAARSQLALTWTIASSPRLMTLAVSPDGQQWTFPGGQPSRQTSVAGPSLLALAAPAGVSPYYWTWTAADGRRTVTLSFASALEAWSAPFALKESAIAGPVLGYPGPSSSVLLAWTGTDSAHHMNLATLVLG